MTKIEGVQQMAPSDHCFAQICLLNIYVNQAEKIAAFSHI